MEAQLEDKTTEDLSGVINTETGVIEEVAIGPLIYKGRQSRLFMRRPLELAWLRAY